MSTLPTLSANELDTLVKSYEKLNPSSALGKTRGFDESLQLGHSRPSRILNPLESDDKKLIEISLKSAEVTPEKYPYLFNQLDKQPKNADDISPKLVIIDAGKSKEGKATALAWLNHSEGILYSHSSIFILDGDKDELLAYGNAADVQSGHTSIYTNPGTSKAAGTLVKVICVSHVVEHGGKLHSIVTTQTRETFDASSFSASVTAPVKKASHSANDYVLIAVGRAASHQNTDADYYYTETENKNDPYLIVPFVGSATLPSTVSIKSGTTGDQIEKISQIYVDYGSSEGQWSLIKNYGNDPTTDKITVSVSDNTVGWSYPSDHKSYEDTSSLVFNPGPANELLSYFFFQFKVPAIGPSAGYFIFTIYSKYSGTGTPPFAVSGSAKTIDPIQFWWHCLAEGTQVNLADGRTLKIEDIDNTCYVEAGEKKLKTQVIGTSIGHHESKAGGIRGVYQLKLEDGKVLTLTGRHPVMTPNGAVVACHLNSGDVVLVEDGQSTVEECEKIEWSGMFHNLGLAKPNNESLTGRDSLNSFYANGILVGDRHTMHQQEEQQRLDLNYILPKLDKKFRIDYANTVKERL